MAATNNPKTILITAGPTIEDIDPVRFISNRATGKLGAETALAACKAGHRVILIHGPISENVLAPLKQLSKRQLEIIPVRSAAQMHAAVMKEVKRADIVIMNAAVADFTPAKQSDVKLKKAESGLILRLTPTVDILQSLGQLKRKQAKLKLVGFALETGRGKTAAEKRAAQISEANRKLTAKNLDAIVLDSPHAMGSDVTDFTVIERSGNAQVYKRASKRAFARILVKLAIRL